jgi:EAL domain-containing protein (putative c-di-GMP-specific phosphodiesterase class I)
LDILLASAPDLIVLRLSAEGIETCKILGVLAQNEFDGRILPIGPRDSPLVAAVHQLGEELGFAMLPTLATPFSAETLSKCVSTLLPREAAPSPAVDVAEALKLGWLELWYQQKVDARTLVPRGAEALIRMRHPTWGLVPPASFVPDVKDPSFREFSEFVVGRALDDWRYFVERQGPVEISINLPVHVLGDRQAIHALCRRVPAHPAFSQLVIEIKSGEAIGNLDLMIDVSKQLRFHNIAISIDDVGAEWPSLLVLNTSPFAELKVDRQFVAGCADDRLRRIVCRGIVDFARSQGLRTVAKGVETRADFRAVHEMGFDLMQGFLLGKPMSARKFASAALRRAVELPAN